MGYNITPDIHLILTITCGCLRPSAQDVAEIADSSGSSGCGQVRVKNPAAGNPTFSATSATSAMLIGSVMRLPWSNTSAL